MILLNELYYLDNFKLVLTAVYERNAQALTDHDKQFIDRFLAAPQAAQALLVRLIMRKGELFLSTKLNYAEIPDVPAVLHLLGSLGWIRFKYQLGLCEAFALFSMAELKRLLPQWPKAASETKALWLLRLLTVQPSLVLQVQDVVELCVNDHAQRFRLLFFGNLKQDWSEFVTEQLGLYRYETVLLKAELRLFNSPAEVDSYMALESGFNDMAQSLLADAPMHLPDIFTQLEQFQAISLYESAWLHRRRDTLLFKLARTAERVQQFRLAEPLYRLCTREESRQRLLRVYELQGKTEQAIELAASALTSPHSDAEQQQLLRMWPRLYKRFLLQNAKDNDRDYDLGHVQQLNRYVRSLGFSAKNIQSIELSLSVELPARVEHRSAKGLAAYAEQSYVVENSLINALFGLLFWEVLFTPIPGAFFHPFQSRPADLFEADFQERRASLFEHAFKTLDTNEYQRIIRQHYVAKQGVQSWFVQWGALSVDLINHALRCIPPNELRLYFKRLLGNLKNNASGMPDIIIFDLLSDRYRWVEVKAPGDKLQDNQVRWFEFFSKNNIEAAVCYVQWANHES